MNKIKNNFLKFKKQKKKKISFFRYKYNLKSNSFIDNVF